MSLSLCARNWQFAMFCEITLHTSRVRSTVLTATPRYYGFLYFFQYSAGGQTPQPILTHNGLNGVDSRKHITNTEVRSRTDQPAIIETIHHRRLAMLAVCRECRLQQTHTDPSISTCLLTGIDDPVDLNRPD